MKTLIKNGLIVTDSERIKADLAIDGEKIQGWFWRNSFDKIIDATGK